MNEEDTQERDSLFEMMKMINELGYDIEISVTPANDCQGSTRLTIGDSTWILDLNNI